MLSAAEFKRLRQESGLTQEQAAVVLETTTRTVVRWEHGDTRIAALKAEAIRRRLKPRESVAK